MRPHQRGAAIVLAMGVVAMAALAAVAMIVSQSTWSREVELTTDHAQAQALVSAGIDWGRAILSDDRRVSNVVDLDEPWAIRLPAIPVTHGSLHGFIDDEQGRFNLNDVVSGGKVIPGQLKDFVRLLSILRLPTDLANALADWVDADNVVRLPGGAEDEYYLSLQPPYLAADRPLVNVGELALVRGFSSSVLARLRPYVTALPRFTAVNVNTCTPEVLAAVVRGLSLDAARAIVAQRNQIYFRSVSDFMRQLPAGATVNSADVSVSSSFFRAHMRARIGPAEARGTALLDSEGVGWPTIVWRKEL